MIDAFIGAAIPVHLLTREAMALYLRKLKPDGLIAMHISNKNLELASVVAGVAEANGVIARVYDGGDVEEDAERYLWVPRVAAIARREQDFGALAKSSYWPVYERDASQRVWSDDYSNVVGAVLRKLRERDRVEETESAAAARISCRQGAIRSSARVPAKAGTQSCQNPRFRGNDRPDGFQHKCA